MTVQPGSRFGPYEIVAPVGAGGMGEVYRARDTRLDRTVAIKVLSKVSPNLRERFDREAKTISALSHPHICALFDVGARDGVEYLVMEYLEGETLADRLSRGPLPVEQVLRYGIEIADALYAAHKHGVVHRDLKPGNVIITKSGAKLLDFGLAKSIAEEAVGGSTLQKPLTEEGMVLGTVQYMAPEQLEGREADARTDIFALGATLYEMATGKRAFEGKSRASLIASILDREPTPISTLQPLTPPALERVIRVCLAKDPDDRWQSAHDIAAELRWISEGSSSADGARASRGVPRRMVWGLAGLAAGLAIGATGIWMSMRERTATPPVARFAIPLPAAAPFVFEPHVGVAISSDGTRLMYRAKTAAGWQLYVRGLNRLSALPIAGTEGALTGAFSPDGHSIIFSTGSRLEKVALDGGVPVQIATLGGPVLGITFGGDNIYYVPAFNAGVWSVPESGGTPRQVIKVDPQHGARALVWPDMLPDGKTIALTVWNNGSWDEAKIVAYPLSGGEPKLIIDGGTCGRYLPSGHFVYARGSTLYAIRFDPSTLRTRGAAVAVLSGVTSGAFNGEVHYDVSRNGTLLYIPGGLLAVDRPLLWIDRHGNEQPVVPTKRPYSGPAISPDGKTIATVLESATFDVWQLDIERDTMTRVSFGGDDGSAQWTPDGRRIIWTSSRSGSNNLYWAAADNSGNEERLTDSAHEQSASGVSPDGRFVAVSERNPASFDIDLVPLSGSHKDTPFIATRFNERDLTFSPDGKWVCYISDESGHYEAYLRAFAGGGRWQLSVDGAGKCKWAHNGHEIFYNHDGKLYVVPVETQPHVRIGKPQFLFAKETPGGPFDFWDVAGDDQKILWIKPEAQAATSEMEIVLNWFEELRRLAPTR